MVISLFKKIVMKIYNTIKKISIKIILILLFFGISGTLYAQSITVTGIVKNAEFGDVIPGVTIVEEGTENGTITDFTGKFTITLTNIPANLVVSYIGYETSVIAVSDESNIEVLLKESTVDVDEVVVVGYGTQKKKVVTGSISSVKSEEISSTSI